MKKAFALFLFSLFFSCQYLEKQVPSEDDLLNKQLKEINWNEVDDYPSVVDCEKLKDASQRKQCFFEFLIANIQQKLPVDSLSIVFPELDTIEVKVTVLPNAVGAQSTPASYFNISTTAFSWSGLNIPTKVLSIGLPT